MHEEMNLHFWLAQHRQGALPPTKLRLWLIINEEDQTVEISIVSLISVTLICSRATFLIASQMLYGTWLVHVKVIQHHIPNGDGRLAYMSYPSGIITVCKVK